MTKGECYVRQLDELHYKAVKFKELLEANFSKHASLVY